MSSIFSRFQIWDWFKTGDKPTQQHFRNVFSSFAHRTEDKHTMGGGLMPWRPRPYEPGETAIINGEIHVFTPVVTPDGSQFFAEDWTPYRKSNTGFALWLNTNTYSTGDYVEFANRIFKMINLAPVQGVAPLNHPQSGLYWTEISAPNGEFGLDYEQTFTENQGEVVGLKGTVWQVTHEGRLRLFKAVFNSQTGATFLSTDFAAELSAGYWVEVAGSVGNNLTSSFTYSYEFKVVFSDEYPIIPSVIDLAAYALNTAYSLVLEAGTYLVMGNFQFTTMLHAQESQGPYRLRLFDLESGSEITTGNLYCTLIPSFSSVAQINAAFRPGIFYLPNAAPISLEMYHNNPNSSLEEWIGRVDLVFLKLS